MNVNRISNLLGIRYPIIQAPMNWVAGADLAAAVSNAGGMGTLGPNAGAEDVTNDVDITGERLRTQIRKVKSLTKNPFAVNVCVGIGEEMLKFSRKVVQVMIEEKVPVAVCAVGSPNVYTKILKDAGIKVLHAVSTAGHAKKAEQVGVDGLICEGFESGGHKGLDELTNFALIPMVADEVNIPIIAGGAISDARGVVAAMALGADGIYMGTRFMVTEESESHRAVKELIVEGKDACTVSVPKGFMIARDLRNTFTRKCTEASKSGATVEELNELGIGGQYRAQHLGDAEEGEICCGQGAGLIHSIESAGDVISNIAGNISSLWQEVNNKLCDFG